MPTAFAFTTERLRALQPKEQRFDVRDTTTPGLVCRVTPGGVKTLCFYRWVPSTGKPERITIGRWPTVSIDTARKCCAAIAAEVALGRSPAQQKRELRAETTLGDLWDRYDTEHLTPHTREKTAKGMRTLWDTYLSRQLKGKRLGEIAHGDLSALHVRIGAKHQRTANKVAGLVRALYRKAAQWGYAGPNPATGMHMFATASRERFLLPEELPKFLQEVQASPSPYNRLWHLLLFTGVRLNNMLAARWEQFDLDAGLWQVPGSAHKNRQPHALPLLPEAVALLRVQLAAVPKHCEWLWPAETKVGHLTQNSIRNEWADLCERAEVPGLWRHDLRRTVGSYLAMSGASLPMVGKALGHRSVQASQVYARLTLDPVREAMAGALKGVASPATPKTSRARPARAGNTTSDT